MLVLIGYIVAFGCIFGMYVLHGGSVGVLVKALPFEMVTIGGGALGAFIVSNQPKVLKATAKAIPSALKPSRYTKARYMEIMALLYELLQKARKEGLMSIESDVEDPQSSTVFQNYPSLQFLDICCCGSLVTGLCFPVEAVIGAIPPKL